MKKCLTFGLLILTINGCAPIVPLPVDVDKETGIVNMKTRPAPFVAMIDWEASKGNALNVCKELEYSDVKLGGISSQCTTYHGLVGCLFTSVGVEYQCL